MANNLPISQISKVRIRGEGKCLHPLFQAKSEILNLPCPTQKPVSSPRTVPSSWCFLFAFRNTLVFSQNRMAAPLEAEHKPWRTCPALWEEAPVGCWMLSSIGKLDPCTQAMALLGVAGSSLVRCQLALGTVSLPISGASHITSGHACLLWCPVPQPFQVFPLRRRSISTLMDHPFDISSHLAPAQKTNQEWHFVTIFSAIAHNLV